MTVSNVAQWVPYQTLEARAVPAGQWWDAVRVPLRTGSDVLRFLGDETGAVIEDSYRGSLYWLVRPKSADHWQLPQAHVLGPGWYVAVPPVHRTSGPGLSWRVPLAPRRQWTDTERLHDALRAATAAAVVPPPPARACCRCERVTQAPVLVRLVTHRTSAHEAVYACPDCVVHCPPGPGNQEGYGTTP